MSDYQETSIAGTSWVRAKDIVIQNHRNNLPCVIVQEERVYSLGDKEVSQDVTNRRIVQNFAESNANTEFNLLNPTDNSIIGTATYQQVYLMLYGLYLHLATEYDARNELP